MCPAVPPLVSVSLGPEDVVVGGEVGVTCSATDGYPAPSEILLIGPRGATHWVKNGQIYRIRNLGLNDSGDYECILPNVAGQPSATRHLNVFSE